MSVVGFNLKKIVAERMKRATGEVKVSTNVVITAIEEHKLSKEESKVLSFSFDFTSTYEPEIGRFKFTGTLLFLCKKEDYETALKQWTEEKQLDKEVGANVIEAILNQCNIVSVLISREVNLPPPLPTRKVSVK